MKLKNYVNDVPNFPKDGIIYRDIQPLLANHNAFTYSISEMYSLHSQKPDYYVGIDARGFIFAAALAKTYGKGLKLVRKAGKLPPPIISTSYDLEYGSDVLEVQEGTGNVTIVDDVFATGGTMDATESLLIKAGYNVINKICLIDIGIVKNHNTRCLISY